MGGAASNPMRAKIAKETRQTSQPGLLYEDGDICDLFIRRKNRPDFVDRFDQSLVESGRAKFLTESTAADDEISPAVTVFFIDRAMTFLNVDGSHPRIKQIFNKTLFPSMRPGTTGWGPGLTASLTADLWGIMV